MRDIPPFSPHRERHPTNLSLVRRDTLPPSFPRRGRDTERGLPPQDEDPYAFTKNPQSLKGMSENVRKCPVKQDPPSLCTLRDGPFLTTQCSLRSSSLCPIASRYSRRLVLQRPSLTNLTPHRERHHHQSLPTVRNIPPTSPHSEKHPTNLSLVRRDTPPPSFPRRGRDTERGRPPPQTSDPHECMVELLPITKRRLR